MVQSPEAARRERGRNRPCRAFPPLSLDLRAFPALAWIRPGRLPLRWPSVAKAMAGAFQSVSRARGPSCLRDSGAVAPSAAAIALKRTTEALSRARAVLYGRRP